MERIKQRIEHYWAKRAEAFAAQRVRELYSPKRPLWEAEFHKYLPQGKPLRILDVGCGTGFFALMLAEAGHQTIGIDLTEDMIRQAKITSGRLGIDAEFFVMDAENPEFEEESFDVIVTRNLTWTLPHLEQAYNAWYDLLVPGGVLVNFDADYRAAIDFDMDETELPKEHAHKNIGEDMIQENAEITLEVGAYQQPRPQWDVQLLTEAGFERIMIDNGVYQRIYATVDEFYNPAQIFTIAAYKGTDFQR